MAVSFNQIPASLRTPGTYVEFDNSRAVRGLPNLLQKVAVIGQRLASGTVAAGVPTRIRSASDADAAFGRGSQLAAMLAAFLAANRNADLTAIALDDDAGGAAATGTLTLAGTALEAGTLVLYVAGTRLQIGVANNATAAQVATSIAAVVNAAATLPVSAAAAGGVVTFNAKNKGTNGNAIDLRVNYALGDETPYGLTVSFAAMHGGSGNPDIGVAIAAMADMHYTTMVLPFADATNLGRIETELANRFGPMEQTEALAFAAAPGSFSATTSLGETRNSPHLCLMGTGKSPTPPWIWAATVAAVDAAEPDPARPRQSLWLPGILPPVPGERFARAERNLLLYSGVSTYSVNAGDTVHIERLITTYRQAVDGTPDESYLDVETMRTLAYIRAAVRARIGLRFPRHKLADDSTRFGPGQAVATPKMIRAELLHLFTELEQAGLVEGFEQFKADLIVERDAQDPNRVNALIPPDLINQLRVFAGLVQFIR